MSSRRTHPALCTALLCLVLGACASTEPEKAAVPSAELVLKTAETIIGQPIGYPDGAAEITAVIVTLPPGTSTGWHHHPVPLFGYMLEGELTVDYGPHGTHLYRPGDALMEAIVTAHDGHNNGTAPVRILAVFMGTGGVPNTVAEK